MTFKEIRQGGTVHILDRDKLELRQGTVTAVSFPRMNIQQPTVQNVGMVVDVTIESDGKPATYTIPENLCVTYANNIVLSTDMQGLAAEVERMKTDAERVLASVDRHKAMIEKSSELLAKLNPQYKERQETEKRFRGIEGDIGNVKEDVGSVKEMVQRLLEKLG